MNAERMLRQLLSTFEQIVTVRSQLSPIDRCRFDDVLRPLTTRIERTLAEFAAENSEQGPFEDRLEQEQACTSALASGNVQEQMRMKDMRETAVGCGREAEVHRQIAQVMVIGSHSSIRASLVASGRCTSRTSKTFTR